MLDYVGASTKELYWLPRYNNTSTRENKYSNATIHYWYGPNKITRAQTINSY